MLPINKEIRDRAEELDMDSEAAVLFCFALEYNLVGYLVEKGLITKNNEHDFRINFTEINGDGDIVNKYPLFKYDGNDSFDSFFNKLVLSGIGINGYSYNAQKYAVLTTDEETKANYNKLRLRIEEYNEDKMVAAIENYYKTVETCKSLKNLFANGADTLYKL